MKESMNQIRTHLKDAFTSTEARVGLGLAAVVGTGMLGVGVSVHEPVESTGTGIEWVAAPVANGITEFRDVTDELLVPGAFNTGIAVETSIAASALAFSLTRRRQGVQE